ncbi:MAG TPA: multicopper oxidase domain-containing protein [Bradyrhizobium sp.]|uniref:multicopper oxidase family protein n=1 Tax=Bradyrhizobium sp. TaxID=376 RepID=UPI002D7FDB26|nr:multicopper oxidase domain-containing protein [Bradyrhizobium sp.]HET7885363.1 multicopper oxidase domain-containing protein [Bradyrhizobium sp.]
MASAQSAALALRCKADHLELKEGRPATAIWSLGDQPLRLKRGDRPEISLTNDLSVPVSLNFWGIDGAAAAEPLLARPPLKPSATDRIALSLRHAGTYFCDLALLGDGAAQPARTLPLIVSESEPVVADRDELVLIEGWRLKPDGAAIAPARDATGTTAVYTVNGQRGCEIAVRGRERLRLRFINGLQRQVIALKIEHHNVTVMALDGQPAEPFLARKGAFALAPGGRADVFVDIAPGAGNTPILMHDGEAAQTIAQLIRSDQPPARGEMLPAPTALPSNGLPAKLDLKSALRVDLAFGGDQKDWLAPASFAAATAAPAFRVKAARAVVLSLTNRAQTTSTFHLHGHHFRHLDRLDDGWKPFWLDTIAIDAGQTQRIAFAAEHAGRWLCETVEARWSAPRLVRWYSVE